MQRKSKQRITGISLEGLYAVAAGGPDKMCYTFYSVKKGLNQYGHQTLRDLTIRHCDIIALSMQRSQKIQMTPASKQVALKWAI